jgi:spore coat protein JB
MSGRERLLKCISEYDFAVIDLNLFLDSHPGDTSASMKAAEYKCKSDELRAEYEEKYGPLQSSETQQNRWAWIRTKWPWEAEREVC